MLFRSTGNIWVPVAIHFINNNMSALLAGGDLGNQVYRWQDTLIVLAAQMIVFMPFLFTKVYKGQTADIQ